MVRGRQEFLKKLVKTPEGYGFRRNRGVAVGFLAGIGATGKIKWLWVNDIKEAEGTYISILQPDSVPRLRIFKLRLARDLSPTSQTSSSRLFSVSHPPIPDLIPLLVGEKISLPLATCHFTPGNRITGERKIGNKERDVLQRDNLRQLKLKQISLIEVYNFWLEKEKKRRASLSSRIVWTKNFGEFRQWIPWRWWNTELRKQSGE